MITLLARLLKALNSDASPAQISLAVVLAMFLGLTPLMSPHNILIVFLVLMLRINLSMFFLGFGAFTVIAYLVDPVSHLLGASLLQAEGLLSLWNALYQSSFWRFLAYNNTQVLGSLSLCVLLSLPLFFMGRWTVINYREHILAWVNNSRLMVWLKGSQLYTTYNLLNN